MTEPAKNGRSKLILLALGVPLFGLFELGLHFKQTHDVVDESSWKMAKEQTLAFAKPEDLVIFAPRWIEPVGNEHFGDVMSLERAAFADVSRYPHAVEVSAHGASRKELADWKTVTTKHAGDLDVFLKENPHYRPVLVDFVKRLAERTATVGVDDASNDGSGEETSCGFVSGSAQTGGLGFGTAVPGQRFNCGGRTFAGVSIVTDLDYKPHRCIAAPPSPNGVLRIHFPNTVLGDVVSGHHALYVEAERHRVGTPVDLTVSFDNESIGRATHTDGTGWRGFEFPTDSLKGKTGDVVFSIRSANTQRRAYCFEAVIQ